jgi:hypothetical protein
MTGIMRYKNKIVENLCALCTNLSQSQPSAMEWMMTGEEVKKGIYKGMKYLVRVDELFPQASNTVSNVEGRWGSTRTTCMDPEYRSYRPSVIPTLSFALLLYLAAVCVPAALCSCDCSASGRTSPSGVDVFAQDL